MASKSFGALRIVSALLVGALLIGCEEGTPTLRSTGSGSSGTLPTPPPSNLPPKTVSITWTANNAKQVGQAGGGYLVYGHPPQKRLPW